MKYTVHIPTGWCLSVVVDASCRAEALYEAHRRIAKGKYDDLIYAELHDAMADVESEDGGDGTT